MFDTKPSKSAIMVSLAGPKSVKAKSWLNDFQGALTLCDFKFQLVHQYRLLGGVIDASASLGLEISGRQLAITEISVHITGISVLKLSSRYISP